jgi:cytochrome c1
MAAHSFSRKLKTGGVCIAASLALTLGLAVPTHAAGEAAKPMDHDFSFEGPFGTFDRAAMQRGFKVYSEVCASCHAMDYMAYRHLGQEGGPFYDPAYPNPNDNPVVKAIAAQYLIEDGPDEYGEMYERDRQPKDPFWEPYPNEAAARAANGGAYPVNLSLITQARKNGPDYVYSLLLGYKEPPEGEERPGLYYNKYFEGNWIAMAEQLSPGLVEYDDGTEATPEQMAEDVVTFLHWAAEPKMETRKAAGIGVLLYLGVLAGLLFLVYKRVWRHIEH